MVQNVRMGNYEDSCESESQSGHLENFDSYERMKVAGLSHSHPVIYEFFPYPDHPKPSAKFEVDYSVALKQGRVRR